MERIKQKFESLCPQNKISALNNTKLQYPEDSPFSEKNYGQRHY